MAGLTGMGLSAVAIIAGAIMRFAVSVQTTGLNINKIGIILMIAGVIGFLISTVLFASTRRAAVGGGTHTLHTETRDSEGHAVVQDKIET
jgi:beta-lactamase regulating signal transducer with metallopeptidase domain